MATVTELHPEADIRLARKRIGILQENLRSTGLNMPGTDAAYRAAIFAGADAETAWEAARRQELMLIGFPDEITENGGLGLPRAMTDAEGSRKRRQALIDTCRALPNPFTLQGDSDEIQRGNSDLGEAA